MLYRINFKSSIPKIPIHYISNYNHIIVCKKLKKGMEGGRKVASEVKSKVKSKREGMRNIGMQVERGEEVRKVGI